MTKKAEILLSEGIKTADYIYSQVEKILTR
jgi:hypothetical protein